MAKCLSISRFAQGLSPGAEHDIFYHKRQ